jgi:hypothetical protein
MTLDDKVDLILNKLNGSEGSVLRNDIQVWLPEGHANPVDNQLIVDVLIKKNLIRLRGPANGDMYIINAKGRRINDKGGWKKFLASKRRDEIIKDVITYSNIVFGLINIFILIYSLNQDNKLEDEVARLRLDLEKQHEVRDDNKRKIDSLEVLLLRQVKTIDNYIEMHKADLTIRTDSSKKVTSKRSIP